VVAKTIASLREAGAEIVDLGEPANLRQSSNPSYEVMLYEFKAGVNAYLAALPSNTRIKTMADVIAFNKEHAADELGIFGQEIMVQADGKGSLTDEAYLEAREKALRFSRAEGIDAMMDKHQLDALVALTTGPAGLGDPVYGGASPGTGGSSALAAVAGYPSITLPAAMVKGLPLGLSFFGRAWSESRLLAQAAAHHVEVARLEDPKRHRAAREQHGAQGKQRQLPHFRVHGARDRSASSSRPCSPPNPPLLITSTRSPASSSAASATTSAGTSGSTRALPPSDAAIPSRSQSSPAGR
jgi:amidase